MKFANRQSGISSTNRRRRRRCAGPPDLINTGMRDTHELTDQQWKILGPLARSPLGDVTAEVGPGRSGG
jgi:hypothetical protein